MIEDTIDNFSVAIGQGELIEHLHGICQSLFQYKLSNLNIALPTLWFTIERLLNQLWLNEIEHRMHTFPDQRERFNTMRRKFLTGRDFTASVISNILEIMDVIEFEDFSNLNDLRQARNDIAHSLRGNYVSVELLRNGYLIALKLINRLYNFNMSLNAQIFSHHI